MYIKVIYFFLKHQERFSKSFTIFLVPKVSHGIELPGYLLLRTSKFDIPSLCPSPCARFRVVVRSLSAFILVQIPAESQVRLKAGSEPKLSQKAHQVVYASCWLLDMSSLYARLACGVKLMRWGDDVSLLDSGSRTVCLSPNLKSS